MCEIRLDSGKLGETGWQSALVREEEASVGLRPKALLPYSSQRLPLILQRDDTLAGLLWGEPSITLWWWMAREPEGLALSIRPCYLANNMGTKAVRNWATNVGYVGVWRRSILAWVGVWCVCVCMRGVRVWKEWGKWKVETEGDERQATIRFTIIAMKKTAHNSLTKLWFYWCSYTEGQCPVHRKNEILACDVWYKYKRRIRKILLF